MKKILFFLLVGVTVIGCSSVKMTLLMPQFKSSETLMIGMEQKKTVGEPMIVIMALKYYPGYVAHNNYTPPSVMGVQMPTVFQNSEWFCPKQFDDGTYCCKPVTGWGSIRLWTGGTIKSEGWNLIIKPSGVPVGFIGDNPIANINVFTEQQPKVFETAEIAQPGSFKQELIYNGKSKHTIKIAYREFKDNFARPAFSQELTYDMSESKEIGFRGMLIEILEATNSYLRFIVRKPMTN